MRLSTINQIQLKYLSQMNSILYVTSNIKNNKSLQLIGFITISNNDKKDNIKSICNDSNNKVVDMYYSCNKEIRN